MPKEKKSRKDKAPFYWGFLSPLIPKTRMGKEIHIHNHFPSAQQDPEIKTLLRQIMANIQDLQAKVSELELSNNQMKQTLDAEQAQIQELLNTNAQVVATLTEQKATLQAQVDELLAAGGTPENLQAVINSIDAVISMSKTTREDLEQTV